MQKVAIRSKSPLADLGVLLLLGTIIYGLVAFGREWKSSFHPATDISLSYYALPYYTLLSAMRGILAYVLSLTFTLVVGYWAAHSPRAERFILPMLDILQSIPVLGFLPGLVLTLIALFPKTNTGLELSSIIMIFTGQVWNMTFSFYSSLKSVPKDFDEASRIIGLSAWQKLWRVEFPFSAMNLVWNSLLSMSGGWFFLSVCEAFTLGKQEYRLPGIGAYMAVAINQGDTGAMLAGIFSMALLIILMDIAIWRPVLAWAHRFRLEEVPGFTSVEPIMRRWIRESLLMRWIYLLYSRRQVHARLAAAHGEDEVARAELPRWRRPEAWISQRTARYLGMVALILFGTLAVIGSFQLVEVLLTVTRDRWALIWGSTAATFVRIIGCLAISTLWTVPLGVWIGTSPKRIRIAQPIIQVLASFPAPMLYPLALAVFFYVGIGFGVGSMFLMLLGVQWYVLFNVLAGVMKVPQELKYATLLMGISDRDTWRKLYLPSIFPSLVTGWVTAAGGAWNASIVAEYISYHGKTLATYGLGATISSAADNGDFSLLAGSLAVMVVVVVVLNRTFWARMYRLAQTRFRLDNII